MHRQPDRADDGKRGDRGYDGAKRLVGRKRHVIVETEGRLVALDVLDAGQSDPDAGQDLLEIAVAEHPRLALLWADGRYQGGFEDRAAELGVRVEIARRPPGAKGFVLQARRWVVERTFAWLLKWRRLVRDYEETAESSKAWIYLAMIRLYLRRLARLAY